MKLLWKWFKRLLKWFFLLLLFVIIIGIIFVNVSPEFGGDPTEEDIAKFEKSGHYSDGKFKNYHKTSRGFSWDVFWSTLKEYYKENPNRDPLFEVPFLNQDSLVLEKTRSEPKLIWFGHSAFLLQLDNKNILLDPMLGQAPSPIKWLSRSRYNKHIPLEIEELPAIDFVFISHDHYDHLDYETIEQIHPKVKQFILPYGVGAHFKYWGIPENKIHEYNWWDEDSIDGLNFAFTPTRHFSGRGLLNHNSTLWGSWVIKGENQKIFFSGDGGYDDHFATIGDKYGPFDIAMVECGQYNKNWKQIHMQPEESALAVKDLKAKFGIPIHWGAFTLSLHDWFEPPVRIKKAADSLGVNIITPEIGETINLNAINLNYNPWWDKLTE